MSINRALDGRPLRVPLNVSLITFAAARNITREVSSIKFRSSVPGGFADCTVDLNRPFADYSDELVQYALLRVTDTRSGAVLWEGRLEDPGRTASESGQVWQLTAYGPQAHAKDHVAPYVAIDSSATNFTRAPHNKKWCDVGTDTYVNPDALTPGSTAPAAFTFSGVKMTATTGVALQVNSAFDYIGCALYTVLADGGQQLGTINGVFGNGNLQGLFTRHYLRLELFDDTAAPLGVTATDFTSPFWDPAHTGAEGQFTWRYGQEFSSAFTGGKFGLAWFRNSNAAETTGPEHWVIVGGPLAIRPRMKDRNGNYRDVTDTATWRYDFVVSHEIFEDLLASRLPLWDPDSTVIDSGFFQTPLNQFAYADPTSVEQLLADLVELEGGKYFWAAWESRPGTVGGVRVWRARAEWSLWPSQVKYVLTMDDGCDLPTSTVELFDSVSVRWRDPSTDAVRTTIVELDNEQLSKVGLHRRGTIDAGDNVVGDLAGAIAYGNAWLQDHAYPRGSGTVNVTRPVMDRDTGRLTWPWEIRPGCLVQIAGADPSAYSQNNGARNGRNVFRVVGVEFDSQDGSARLELDSPAFSIDQQTADANRNKITRRR